jgi:glycosyltransferase involved in cell wall biosynthesis
MKETLLTIITVVKNDEKNIENTIKSVLSQKKYFPFEYIVLDGFSKDKTFKIIKKYNNQIDYIESKKDKGMYYALNDAIKLSNGKYIGILHSGDLFTSDKVISKYRSLLEADKYDMLFSNLKIIGDKKTHRFYDASFFEKKHLLMGWMPPHPTCIIKKKVIQKVNYYDTYFKISSDFDLILKLIMKNNITFKYIPILSVFQSRGGMSDRGFLSKIIILKEIIISLKRNRLLKNPFLIILRYFIKFREVIYKND